MKIPPIIRISFSLACLASLVLSVSSASASLLLDMNFNNPDTLVTAVASSVGGYSFNTLATNGTATAIQNGTGVSGAAGDYSLNLTSATRMGGSDNTAAGPVATYAANSGLAIASQTSLTLAGWFRTDTTTQVGGSARILELSTLSINAGSSSGTLSLNINGVTLTSDADYTATQEWVFFAVTFDGSIASGDNVSFYIGGLDSSVSLVSSGRIELSNWGGYAAETSSNTIRIGNTATGTSARARPFDGYLDDLQLYGAATGSSGALTLSELEAIRAAAVPEPAAWLLMSLGLAAVACRAHRRKKVRVC